MFEVFFLYIDILKNISLTDLQKNLILIITKNNLSLSTICRILKDNKISRKKLNIRIVCKDIDKIAKDRIKCSSLIDDTFYDYISIDKSSFFASIMFQIMDILKKMLK